MCVRVDNRGGDDGGEEEAWLAEGGVASVVVARAGGWSCGLVQEAAVRDVPHLTPGGGAWGGMGSLRGLCLTLSPRGLQWAAVDPPEKPKQHYTWN